MYCFASICCSTYFLFVLFSVFFASICCSTYFLFVLFYVLFLCKYVLLPPGVNPVAVKSIVSYHISKLQCINWYIVACFSG
jgi:hypothetical protein